MSRKVRAQAKKLGVRYSFLFMRADGTQLHEIAGDEACSQTEVTENMDQQPRRVAARAGAAGQRLLRRLNAWLHADDIADLFLQLRVELDQKIDRAVGLARNILQIRREQRPLLRGRKIRRKLDLEIVGVFKRITGGITSDKEVKRIDDRHLRGEVDFDLQLRRLLRKHKARQPVALRILLPVHEMICRRDLERIAQDRRPRMRRRAQANGLRAEIDRSVVFVVRDVV